MPESPSEQLTELHEAMRKEYALIERGLRSDEFHDGMVEGSRRIYEHLWNFSNIIAQVAAQEQAPKGICADELHIGSLGAMCVRVVGHEGNHEAPGSGVRYSWTDPNPELAS